MWIPHERLTPNTADLYFIIHAFSPFVNGMDVEIFGRLIFLGNLGKGIIKPLLFFVNRIKIV